MFSQIKQNTFRLAIFFMVIAALTGCVKTSTPFRRCSNNKPMPLDVQLENCTKLPCSVATGSTINIAVHFVALKNSMQNIGATLHATALGIRLPYELQEERADVCRNLMFGAYCPLDAGEDVVYHMTLTVSPNQMEVPTTIEVHVLDRDDASVLACFLTDLRIKKSIV